MRGIWRGWILALGVVLLTGSVSMAQPAAARKDIAESSAWWSDLFSFGSSKSATRPTPEPSNYDTGGDTGGDPAASPVPEPTVGNKAEQVQRLRNALERRQAVIDRLREIATDTDNIALAEEANRLEEMALRIYQKESNRILGVATIVPEPDALERGNAARNSGQAIRSASPGGALPRENDTPTESLERSAALPGGDR